MTPAGDQNLLRADVWSSALARYSAATHLTVEVTGLDGARLFEPLSPTPLFEALARGGWREDLFAACARRCLTPGDVANPIVEQRHGLAVVGTRLSLEGTIIGAAVAGYVITAFPDQPRTQRLAQESHAAYADLWFLLRRELPLAQERLLVYGELLQTVCDTLLNEYQRTRQLETASARLAAESEAKDRFLAMLSHELRTPLTAMLGWVRMLRTGPVSEETTMKALEVIERNTKLQTQLIEDLLHVSRIVSGKVELDRRTLDLAPVVAAVIETMRPAAEGKELQLDVVLSPAAGLVLADPARIGQVVSNLVSNAIKFTPTGGRVDVRLARIAGEVCLTVADTGVGITAEFLPHVFDRFSQADANITRAYAGLGLGLMIARHLVELHGGRVEAASRGKDQGATFMVRLPALAVGTRESEQGVFTVEAAGNVDVPSLEGVRVLLVDDEADARELFKDILEQHQADVAAVSSAEEAFNLLASWRPDVLVSDIGMPAQNGYDLIRAVRRLAPSKGASIPALAVTAYARPEDSRLALAAGFQFHLAKPIEPTALARAIAQLAGRMEVA